MQSALFSTTYICLLAYVISWVLPFSPGLLGLCRLRLKELELYQILYGNLTYPGSGLCFNAGPGCPVLVHATSMECQCLCPASNKLIAHPTCPFGQVI